MNRLSSAAPNTGSSMHGRRRRLGPIAPLAALAVGALVLVGCGGGDDDDDAGDSSTTTSEATAATTTAAPSAAATTTAAPAATTTTAPDLETEGAVVVVANASGIDGAAGRLSDRLEVAGFTMTDATNSSDTVGQLGTTEIHYVAADAAALAVAQSVAQVLGGGDIELVEVATPAPTESGELGAATVLVLMGNDVADKPLSELQGGAPTDTGGESTGEGTAESTGEGTAEATGEDTADDG